jgi:hypothetical protein
MLSTKNKSKSKNEVVDSRNKKSMMISYYKSGVRAMLDVKLRVRRIKRSSVKTPEGLDDDTNESRTRVKSYIKSREYNMAKDYSLYTVTVNTLGQV